MNRSVLTVPVERMEAGTSVQVQDLLAVEEPLEIRLNDQPVSITMRTPGHDFELAAGFLFSEGIVRSARDIGDIRHGESNANPRQAGNSVIVGLDSEVPVDLERLKRHFYTTSSCGVCGKASIEALTVQGCSMAARETPSVRASVIYGLPDALRKAQPVFERTGGLHAAGLFDASGALLAVREDVGRHNAVDKLIGAEFLAGRTPLHERMVLVSGRASFELVQKCVVAGVPVLASVGAPSSLAVEAARRFGMTLLGFVRDGRFNIYPGHRRIAP
jgi:FdhD protein